LLGGRAEGWQQGGDGAMMVLSRVKWRYGITGDHLVRNIDPVDGIFA
jgi:hypothetical protein